MTPTRADLTFWQAHVVERGAPAWARAIKRPKYAPHVSEHLDRAINERAGQKRDIGAATWTGALVLLRMVRGNQSRIVRARDPYTGEPEPRTLAGYMLDSLAKRGSGYNERRIFFRRILARMPRDVIERGVADLIINR